MDALLKAIGAVVVVFGLLVIFAAVFALPTYWLWNWLMPTIFHLPTITFFQAWGVNALCGGLFKSHLSSKS